jgi:TonB family protein
MFHSLLMAAHEDGRRDRRRLWVLASSVLLHAAAFATLAAVQTWRVEAVAEPPANDVYQVLLPAPLPAEPERPAAGRRLAQPVRQAETAPPAPTRPPVVQPRSADPALEPPAPGPVRDGNGSLPDGSGDDGAGHRGADDGPLPVGGPISRPQIIPGTRVQPVYTELARQAHLSGPVVLQATIDEGGNVIDVRVLRPLPMGLDREAVRAVSQWKFTPALLHGRPVKVFFTVTVQYEVR